MWSIRKRLWNWVTTVKYRGNKPARIPVPSETQQKLGKVRLPERLPDIPIHNILIGDHIPQDERAPGKQLFYDLQLKMMRLFPPMQEGLPPIDADPFKALDEACTPAHRNLFDPPELPEEYRGTPDLGRLAVASPYACYVERAPEGGYQWDFRQLGQYEYHPGLRSLGLRVLFRVDEAHRRLEAVRIESAEMGTTTPSDVSWRLACKLALCAATTHLSLVRHLNWTHLIGGTAIALATRNHLPANHPVRRLLWPHVYGTQNSNLLTIKSQLVPGGDFEAIFSFTHRGLCKLLEDTHDEFDLSRMDPERDAHRRGLWEGGFETPALDNRRELFEVMYAHASRYLDLYYSSDEALRRDGALLDWLRELKEILPAPLEPLGGEPTLASTARLIAVFIYLESVEHEILGTGVWNYQLWTHVQPVRVYRNGQREPLDVYQRLVNANFILNVHRTPLLEDFSYLALDAEGAAAMRTFRDELQALQDRLNQRPRPPWRIDPHILEANINA